MRDNSKVFIIHARPLEPCPIDGRIEIKHWSARRGATFAVKRGRFNNYYVAMALCGKKDNYNRKIGRTIAVSRLEQKKFWQSKRGLSSALVAIKEKCKKHGFVVPEASVKYLEETYANGKSVR